RNDARTLARFRESRSRDEPLNVAVPCLRSHRLVPIGCYQPSMRREHALGREKISISHDKGAHLFVGYHIFPIFVRPSVEEWRVNDSAPRSLGGSAKPGAERFAMETHIRRTKERFIDHAKPRCHRADGML